MIKTESQLFFCLITLTDQMENLSHSRVRLHTKLRQGLTDKHLSHGGSEPSQASHRIHWGEGRIKGI